MNKGISSIYARLALLLSLFTVGAIAQVGLSSFSTSAQKSELRFSGEHAGMPFDGRFEQWSADLVLPPAESPSIVASFDLTSAVTGDRTYDSTLSEGDWFDVENTPTASFSAASIKALSNGDFDVSGVLTIKGIKHTNQFLLRQSDNGYVADIKVDRLAYKIGLDSDPDAEWVSQIINLRLKIVL